MRSFLVTGATGSIGVPLIRKLLTEGADVTILTRPKKHSEETIKRLFGGRVKILFGDTTEVMCGVTQLPDRRFDCMIHAAGLTQYHQDLSAKTHAANEFGTANALALATELDIPKFVFISTCYVAGNQLYLAENDVGKPENAHNPYESSKIKAEALVRLWPGQKLILRLSTIIGDSKTGEIVNAGGYAGFVKSFWALRKGILPYEGNPFMVGINPASTLNLLPRDWTVQMICNAARSELEGTIHLSHPKPVNLGHLFKETFQRRFPLPLTYDKLVADVTALYKDGNWAAIQAAIAASVTYFGPYVTQDTTFEHERAKLIPGYTPPPIVDDEMIRVQIEYMLNNLFAKKPKLVEVAA
jgi:nucleoside-diphosphate-sugar epimerase